MVQLELRDESPRWARQSAGVGRREDQYGRGEQRAARRPECDLFQASSPKNDAKLVVLIKVVLALTLHMNDVVADAGDWMQSDSERVTQGYFRESPKDSIGEYPSTCGTGEKREGGCSTGNGPLSRIAAIVGGGCSSPQTARLCLKALIQSPGVADGLEHWASLLI